MKLPLLLALSLFVGLFRGTAQPAASTPPAKQLPMPGRTLSVEGRQAFVILPAAKADAGPLPWVWYAPTLPGLPGVEEKWMFEKFLAAGIAIAGIDVGESYGSPAGRALFSAFYREATSHLNLNSKPILLARSRGGLMAYAWAVENPGSVGGIAGIYPVCTPASYPGLHKAAPAYGLTAAQMRDELPKHNAIEHLAGLAKAKVPIFHIHGDVDAVVPLEANTAEVERRYRGLGGKMEVLVPKGQGHNMWEGFFQCRELVEFVVRQAKVAKP